MKGSPNLKHHRVTAGFELLDWHPSRRATQKLALTSEQIKDQKQTLRGSHTLAIEPSILDGIKILLLTSTVKRITADVG